MLPLVELRLAEAEMAQQCPACERFELPGDEERFKRCGKCKKRYYVRRFVLFHRASETDLLLAVFFAGELRTPRHFQRA